MQLFQEQLEVSPLSLVVIRRGRTFCIQMATASSFVTSQYEVLFSCCLCPVRYLISVCLFCCFAVFSICRDFSGIFSKKTYFLAVCVCVWTLYSRLTAWILMKCTEIWLLFISVICKFIVLILWGRVICARVFYDWVLYWILLMALSKLWVLGICSSTTSTESCKVGLLQA